MMFTHVGYKGAAGNYAVTADAHRKPGKSHALRVEGGAYRALCGVAVDPAREHDCFAPDVVTSAAQGKVTCKRCRRKIAETA